MTGYPDTSFLYALYRRQENTAQAISRRASITGPLPVTALVLYEFRQSVRWQNWLHHKDASKGYGESEGAGMLAHLQSDLTNGLVQIVSVDWAKVISRAEQLSARQTAQSGHRAFDILHVATALELGATEFLAFDFNQRKLAQAAGLKAKP